MNGRGSKVSLNCSLAPPPTTTTADGGHTPNTPEILNTIVNITSGFSNGPRFSSRPLQGPNPIALLSSYNSRRGPSGLPVTSLHTPSIVVIPPSPSSSQPNSSLHSAYSISQPDFQPLLQNQVQTFEENPSSLPPLLPLLEPLAPNLLQQSHHLSSPNQLTEECLPSPHLPIPSQPSPHLPAALLPSPHLPIPSQPSPHLPAALLPSPHLPIPSQPSSHLPIPSQPSPHLPAPLLPSSHLSSPVYSESSERSFIRSPSPLHYKNIGEYKPEYKTIGEYKPEYKNIGEYKPEYKNIGEYKPEYKIIGEYKPEYKQTSEYSEYSSAEYTPQYTGMPPLTTKCTTESRCPPQYQTRPVQQYRNTEVGTVQQYQPGEVGTVQQYHSFFIKEGLRMKVKQNLKDEDNGQDALETELKTENDEELTPEDEERRVRRRERNKVAATKCRNKKKEKTVLLISEGEILENQNISLKQEISRLESEKRHLVEILALHEPTCAKRPRRDLPTREETRTPKEETNSHTPSVPGFSRQESLLQTLEILENLEFTQTKDEKDEPGDFHDETTDSSEDGYSKPLSSQDESRRKNDEFKSYSYPSSAQSSYFVVNKPTSLSYQHSFSIDSRCVAL